VPLSPEPRKRARQLANLRPAPAAPRGNRRGMSHGGYATIARDRLEAKQREVFDALAADAPLPDAGDELPRHYAAHVALLAEVLRRLDDVNAYLAARGYLDGQGNVRPAAELTGRMRREASDYLDALGMTPKSRAKLGLDLQRTVDLASAMSEPDDERRAEPLAEAGLEPEEGGVRGPTILPPQGNCGACWPRAGRIRLRPSFRLPGLAREPCDTQVARLGHREDLCARPRAPLLAPVRDARCRPPHAPYWARHTARKVDEEAK
jgi:hypothetical protein